VDIAADNLEISRRAAGLATLFAELQMIGIEQRRAA